MTDRAIKGVGILMGQIMTDVNEEEKSTSTETAVADPELLVKHPLENRWSLWYFKNDRSRDWSDNLKLVSTFGFVEDFWA